MSVYRVTTPTGEAYNVTAPEGATQDQVMAYAQAHHASAASPAKPAAPIHIRAPDGSTVAFPAGMADAEIEAVMAREYPRPSAAPASGYNQAKAALATSQASRDPGGTGAGTNMLDAMTYGHGGELQGAGDAAKTAVVNAARRAVGMTPKYTAADTYRASRDSFDAASAAEKKAHPVGATSSAVLGSIVAPGMLKGGKWVSDAKTMGEMMLRSAGVMGAAGAAYGHGEAKEGERTKGTLLGGATGAALGAVLPPVVSYGGRAVARFAAPILDPLVSRIKPLLDDLKGLPATMDAQAQAAAAKLATQKAAIAAARPTNPQLRAAQAIKNAADRDAQAGFTPRPGALPMHAGGDNMAALYEVAAKSPGPARQMIRQGVKDSRAATYNDVESDLGTQLGGKGDYFATLDKLTKDRASNAATGMAGLGRHLVTLDENSVSALRSDLAKGAMKKAATNGLASTDPDVRAGAASLNRLSDAVLDKPSAQTMTVREAQDVSEALLSAADSAYSGGDGATGKALKGLGKAIRENARTPERGGFSEYDDWLKQYGTDSENKRALELGSTAMTSGLKNSPEAVARELSDMGASAMDHYRKGVGEALIDKVRGANGDVKVMRGLLGDKNLAARVRLAFPDDASFAGFLDAADGRVAQADLNNRYMGGSGTGPMGAVRDDLEREGADLSGVAGDVLTGNLGALSGRALKGALKAIPRKASSAITDPEANAALGRSAMDPDEVTRLLNMLQASKRIALAPKTTQALVTAGPGATRR